CALRRWRHDRTAASCRRFAVVRGFRRDLAAAGPRVSGSDRARPPAVGAAAGPPARCAVAAVHRKRVVPPALCPARRAVLAAIFGALRAAASTRSPATCAATAAAGTRWGLDRQSAGHRWCRGHPDRRRVAVGAGCPSRHSAPGVPRRGRSVLAAALVAAAWWSYARPGGRVGAI